MRACKSTNIKILAQVISNNIHANKTAQKNIYMKKNTKLEDLKVLKRSLNIGPQDLNNVKLGQGQPRLII